MCYSPVGRTDGFRSFSTIACFAAETLKTFLGNHCCDTSFNALVWSGVLVQVARDKNTCHLKACNCITCRSYLCFDQRWISTFQSRWVCASLPNLVAILRHPHSHWLWTSLLNAPSRLLIPLHVAQVILGPFFWNGLGWPGPVSSCDRSFGPNRSGPRKKNG